MNIDIVLPASPIPCEVPPPASAQTDSGAETLLFTTALEGEILKTLPESLPQIASDNAAQAVAVPGFAEARGVGASLVSTGIVQFLVPDSEKPKSDQAIKASDAEQTATALPSLLGLIWNEPVWQILPSPATGPENSSTEVEEQSSRPELPSITTPNADCPPADFVEPVLRELTAAPILPTREPVNFTVPAQERNIPVVVEPTPKPAPKASATAPPVLPEKMTANDRPIEGATPTTNTPQTDEKPQSLQQTPTPEVEATETAPVSTRPRTEERHSLQSSNEPSQAQAPPQELSGPDAWTVTVETGTIETPRKDESSERETKSTSPDLDAPKAVVMTDPTPVTAVSREAEPNGRESRQPVDRGIQIETAAKTSAPRDKDALAPPSIAPSTRPETKVAEHNIVGSAVVPHGTKPHATESVKPLETVPSDQTTQWTQIEKSNIVLQLVEKARSLRLDRSSEIVVSLKPESLGRISLRASLVDRTMVATIAAESDKVRQLLQLELPAIQKSLQETGIVAKVAVLEQSDLNFGNNLSQGQPRFRQNDALPFREELISQNPAATTEVADARYSTHSVHLIA